MGRFMIPVCCVCGKSPIDWNNRDWYDTGGLQDFCPTHAQEIESNFGPLKEYLVPHMRSIEE